MKLFHRVLLVLPLFAAACGGRPAPLNPPITFTLENEGALSVYTQRAGCGLETWLTISDQSGNALSFPGACAHLCGGPPTACPAYACVAPSVEELKPAMNITESWDGIYQRAMPSENCVEELGASGELSATACWGDPPSSGSDRHAIGMIQNQRCKSTKFVVGRDANVRLVISE